MRPFFLTIVSMVSISVVAGCAAGLRAESVPIRVAMPSSAEIVRVRILYTKQPSRLEATGPFQYQLTKGGEIFPGQTSQRVRSMSRALVFNHKRFDGDVVAVPVNSTDTLKINGRRYRGALVFHALPGGRYDVIESVDLQEYLYGVLPREVGTDWPLEALKAQAVVSRTYAMANMAQASRGRFDLSDGVFDQVYGGREVEAASSNQAVDETRGEVLLDSSGKPIQAFFHSSCGGRTELPKNVWRSSISDETYGCIADPYCQEDPHYQWHVEISFDAMRKRLRKAGIRVDAIRKISIVQKSVSGRAVTIGLQTAKGVMEVSGNRFRIAMGADSLRSTLFTNLKQTKKTVFFEGHGWGHGAGLCQWGAHGRAIAGQKYDIILKAYFPKAFLKKYERSSP